mmetsp:Transcript_101756/g.294478  ORF Transcript_101756/g.294478 Transcript_101756/m.294478 type:complete len:436 (+) Transcript_101756:2113-3420(+)
MSRTTPRGSASRATFRPSSQARAPSPLPAVAATPPPPPPLPAPSHRPAAGAWRRMMAGPPAIPRGSPTTTRPRPSPWMAAPPRPTMVRAASALMRQAATHGSPAGAQRSMKATHPATPRGSPPTTRPRPSPWMAAPPHPKMARAAPASATTGGPTAGARRSMTATSPATPRGSPPTTRPRPSPWMAAPPHPTVVQAASALKRRAKICGPPAGARQSMTATHPATPRHSATTATCRPWPGMGAPPAPACRSRSCTAAPTPPAPSATAVPPPSSARRPSTTAARRALRRRQSPPEPPPTSPPVSARPGQLCDPPASRAWTANPSPHSARATPPVHPTRRVPRCASGPSRARAQPTTTPNGTGTNLRVGPTGSPWAPPTARPTAVSPAPARSMPVAARRRNLGPAWRRPLSLRPCRETAPLQFRSRAGCHRRTRTPRR